MLHAFGIRSASSTDGAAAKLARLGVPGARIVSDPTNIRSASGSNHLSGDFLSTYQSSVGGNPRSLSVRDSNQAVGMKNNALEVPLDTSQVCAQIRTSTHFSLAPGLTAICALILVMGSLSPQSLGHPPKLNRALSSTTMPFIQLAASPGIMMTSSAMPSRHLHLSIRSPTRSTTSVFHNPPKPTDWAQ